MKCRSLTLKFLLALALLAVAPPARAQQEPECDFNEFFSGNLTTGRIVCRFLNHEWVFDFLGINDPTFTVTVRGPVVNTSRTFNVEDPDYNTQVTLWFNDIIAQISAGVSLSAPVPSTNVTINSTLRTFSSVVMPNVNLQARAQEATSAAGETEQQREARVKPGEVSSDVEYETFTFVGQDGSSIAFRGALERTTDSGGLGFGVRLAYSRVSFADSDNRIQSGEATAFLKFPLSDFLDIGANVTGTISSLKTKTSDQESHAFGFGPFVSLYTVFDAGHMLAAGLMYQIVKPKDEAGQSSDDVRVLAYGAMGVYTLSKKLGVSVEGFRMDNLEIEGKDDAFTILHPQLHFYLSDAFGLILGYKTVLGIDDYDSAEFTLGSSVRF
jgi:hypothetical protein